MENLEQPAPTKPGFFKPDSAGAARNGRLAHEKRANAQPRATHTESLDLSDNAPTATLSLAVPSAPTPHSAPA